MWNIKKKKKMEFKNKILVYCSNIKKVTEVLENYATQLYYNVNLQA